MQKLMLAVFGAVCVLASAQYESYGNDGHKLQIKHSWEQKGYKGDEYGKGGDGYGKRQEGSSSRYFEMQVNKGMTAYHAYWPIELLNGLLCIGYERKYEPKKYEVYTSDDKYDTNNYKKNDYKYETRYEPMIKYEDNYKKNDYKYESKYEPMIKYEDNYKNDDYKYETKYEPIVKYEDNYKSDNYGKYQERYEPKKYEIKYDSYNTRIMDDLKKYETRDSYYSNDKYDTKKNCYGCY